jgi:hypothetical protein
MTALGTDDSLANRSAKRGDFGLEVIGHTGLRFGSPLGAPHRLLHEPLSLFLIDRFKSFRGNLLLQGTVVGFVQFSCVEIVLDIAKRQEGYVASVLGFGEFFIGPFHGRLAPHNDGIQDEEDRP